LNSIRCDLSLRDIKDSIAEKLEVRKLAQPCLAQRAAASRSTSKTHGAAVGSGKSAKRWWSGKPRRVCWYVCVSYA